MELIWISGLWICVVFPAVVAMAIASHHIGRYLKKQPKVASHLLEFQPSTSASDIMLAKSYRYAFGFVFISPVAFWRLVFTVTRGREMQPIQRWMRLWLIGHLSILSIWVVSFGLIIRHVFA